VSGLAPRALKVSAHPRHLNGVVAREGLWPLATVPTICSEAYWVLRFERFRCPRCSNYFRRSSVRDPKNGLNSCRSGGLRLYDSA
jgi:hypothetical protein